VGWRLSFAATGLISLLYFALFWHVYRDPAEDPELTAEELTHIQQDIAPQTATQTEAQTEASPTNSKTPTAAAQPTATEAAHPEPPQATLAYLIRQKKVLGLALGFGSYNYVFYLLLTWLPSYLSSALHIDLLHSFLYTGVPWLVATFGDLAGGFTADALIRRGWNPSRVRTSFLVCGTACGLGILGSAGAHTPLRALLWISLSIGGLSAAAPVGWSIPALIAPKAKSGTSTCVGTIGGILNFSNQLSGIAAPILTGYVVASTGAYAWAFVIAAAYLLVGIASYLFLLGRIEPLSTPNPA